MEIRGATIEQLDKSKPRSRCRKWRLWVTTGQGRKSHRFSGTYTEASEALEAFRAELSETIPDSESFASYARAWQQYREKSGAFAPNTIVRDKRGVNAICRSPMGPRSLDSITPETCREDLLWIKGHPRIKSIAELSGTSMACIYAVMELILSQAVADGRMAANPLDAVIAPRNDTEEREALPWDRLMGILDMLDAEEPTGFSAALYAIICHGLRRGEACALADDDVTGEYLHVRSAIKTQGGEIGGPKSKAGRRTHPAVPRMVRMAERWRAVRDSKGLGDGVLFVCGPRGGVLRPSSLYEWWERRRHELGCDGVTLHQLRHSTLTRMARHMSLFDLMRYAGWSSPAPARTYIHDDFAALKSGVESAWGEPSD